MTKKHILIVMITLSETAVPIIKPNGNIPINIVDNNSAFLAIELLISNFKKLFY